MPMESELSLFLAARQTAEAANELTCVNAVSEQFGLTLTMEELKRLVAAQCEALNENGRIAFGPGVLPLLVDAFCDSPFLLQEDWAETLLALQEAFYYYKGEAMERFSDDELVALMQDAFNGCAQGDVAYLTGTTLAELCRSARAGGVLPWETSLEERE